MSNSPNCKGGNHLSLCVCIRTDLYACVFRHTQIYGYSIIRRTQCVFLQIRHTHSVLFLSLKWHIWTSVPGKIPPSLQKDCKLVQSPKSLWLRIVGFKLIQNVFGLMESSEDRSLLKQRNRLLPVGRRWTRAAFTLCDTLDFCRAIKNWSCFSPIETSLFQLQVEGMSWSVSQAWLCIHPGLC